MAERICKIDECPDKVLARGWCRHHYYSWRNHGDPLKAPYRRDQGQPCIIDGCTNSRYGHGLCSMHYQRQRKNGDALYGPLKSKPPHERFWAYVAEPDERGCRIWTASTDRNGYGFFSVNGPTVYAHRYAVILSGREIPDGFHADHFCRNRSCVEATHLDVVTREENMRRQVLTPAEHFALRLVSGGT